MLHDLADVLQGIDDRPIRTAPVPLAPAPTAEAKPKRLYVLVKLLNFADKEFANGAHPNKIKAENLNSPIIVCIPDTPTTLPELKQLIADTVTSDGRCPLFNSFVVQCIQHSRFQLNNTRVKEVDIRWRPDDEGWDQRLDWNNSVVALHMLRSTTGPQRLVAQTNWIWTAAKPDGGSFVVLKTPYGSQNRHEKVKEDSGKRKLGRDSDVKDPHPILKRAQVEERERGDDKEETDSEDEATEKQSESDEDTSAEEEVEQKPKYGLRKRTEKKY